MNVISAILLAAGQSKRIRGENKLLKKYKGKILINHILKSLIKSKANKIIIVLGYENRKIKKIALKSKKTHENRCKRLKEAGFSEKEINSIHGPIGIKLGGRSAPEIALSIIAQLVAETYNK